MIWAADPTSVAVLKIPFVNDLGFDFDCRLMTGPYNSMFVAIKMQFEALLLHDRIRQRMLNIHKLL